MYYSAVEAVFGLNNKEGSMFHISAKVQDLFPLWFFMCFRYLCLIPPLTVLKCLEKSGRYATETCCFTTFEAYQQALYFIL